ncbi:MAG: response regulator, partial [Thermodesulfovibrionales bacterium]|nr:response regulator [Thermodesulfovibrionales bacterium]
MIKVLIVDDSAFMRNALTNMLSSDPEIKIIGTAKDGLEAVELVSKLKPDIVTMDVEMPRMDGITALKNIMEKTPVPVIMVSSLTIEGAKVTLEALEIGAVDFIPKNLSELSINIVKIKEMLLEKIKYLGKKGVPKKLLTKKPPITTFTPQPKAKETPQAPPQVVMRSTGDRKVSLVAIGTSTGGPKA